MKNPHNTPNWLEERYEWLRATPSDINEHLSTLRKYAEACGPEAHVTEMGVRTAVSTTAFMAARPKTLISWDIESLSIISQNIADLAVCAKIEGRTNFQPRVGNTLEVYTEPTDLLFIDTLHTGKQLLAELERHAEPRDDATPFKRRSVKKYLVFHDTQTFGLVGEDGKEPGLRAAIRHFQRNHAAPLWELLEDKENNNGLVVLGHICRDGHSPSRINGKCTWCGQL